MSITAGNILLIGAFLLFISLLVSKLSSRFGIPTLLLFLLVGMFFGSDGLGIQFSDMKHAQFIGMIALSIILFSGGMDTKFAEIKPVIWPGVVLSTLGVLLTALFTGLFIYLVSGSALISVTFSFPLALLLASTMSSTDSASVFNVLRTQKMGLKHNLRPMLELESGSNDPVAYMLTIALIGALQTDSLGVGHILLLFIVQLVVGALAGYCIGKAAVWVINKINLSNASLYPILLLALVFFTFSFTELIKGNGYLAVYLAGIMVGNHPLVKKMEITTFMDGLTWLFQIVMFLVLGLLVNPHEMLEIAPFALLVGVFLMVVARPLSVFLTLLPFKRITFKSKAFISWVGLRGAVPIIFATYPVVAKIEGAQNIFNIVFFITILSLILQGMSIPSVAKWLKLTTKLKKTGNDFGVVIPEEIGSKVWDVVVTEAMLKQGKRLADMSLPKGVLVILIDRGGKTIIPDGKMELHVKDKLLLISPQDQEEPHVLQLQD